MPIHFSKLINIIGTLNIWSKSTESVCILEGSVCLHVHCMCVSVRVCAPVRDNGLCK